MKLEHSADALSVLAGGVELLRYVFRPDMDPFEGPKPYLHPVRTLAGDVVTAYRPHDHRWHKGIQMTASHVSGENFWGGGSYVRGKGYVDLPNVGTMRHEEFTEIAADGDRVLIAERLTWHTQSGRHWIDENRTLTVHDVADGAWTLTFTTSLRNVRDAPLTFGSPTTNGRELAGYTGLFWRGPRPFTGGEIVASDGRGGEAVMGEPGPWLAFVGRHDEVDRASTLLFVDPPGARTRWFVRSGPFAAVNPSFAFHDELVLDAGDTLDLAHRIVIADTAWDRDRIEAHAKEQTW
ncbi:PmoA family protein [Actinomadura miaoliensis]|uniref:PmoA family protein n=1 Tax=Actinomadura miaoliensis TaxID=430685 RepID=A0ABP7WUZ1_9ACTN